jgi:hypothetical protein
MQCACTMFYPAVPYFSTLSHKYHNFRKSSLNIRCVFRFSLQLLSETSHFKKNSAKYHKCLHVTYALFLSDCNEIKFLDVFSANTQNMKFNENLSIGSCVVPCVRTDRRTEGQAANQKDVMKSAVAVRSFANAHRKYTLVIQTEICLSRTKQQTFN